jgi:hypothetical protein
MGFSIARQTANGKIERAHEDAGGCSVIHSGVATLERRASLAE